MIHRQNCGNLAEYRKQPEKWLSVAWEATQGKLFSLRDPARHQQSRGGPRGRGLGHRGNGDEHRSGVAGGARREQLLAAIPASGARPQAPGPRHPHHSPHAGRAARLSARSLERAAATNNHRSGTETHGQADHFHRRCTRRHRRLFPGGRGRQHPVGVGANPAGSEDQGAGAAAESRRRSTRCSRTSRPS